MVPRKPQTQPRGCERDLEVLLEVGRVLTSSLDLATRLEQVLDLALPLFDADRVSVMLPDVRGEYLNVVASRGLAEPADHARVRVGEGIAGWVAAHKESLVLNDPLKDERFASTSPGLSSSMAVPLMAEGRLVGVLNIATSKPVHYTEDDLRYLTFFAGQAAVAIDNSRLYNQLEAKQQVLERELIMASRIQRSIISSYVPNPLVRVAAKLMPASAVGGDFYSVIPLARDSRFCFYCSPEIQDQCGEFVTAYCPNKFGLMIGDVANKGLPAALIMAVLTTSLYELGQVNNSPRAVLEQANTIFNRFFFESQYGFATVFYCFFDGNNMSITYSKAGHDSPVILRTNGEPQFLDAEGFPLGLNEDGEYEEKTVSLAEGDRLILYTDGVTGALNDQGQILGRARFTELVKRGHGKSLDQFMETLVDEIMLFGGDAPPTDDIALMIMELQEQFDFYMEIPSEIGAVRDAVEAVLDLVAGTGSPEKLQEMHLCLEELVRNAVEHGNKNDPSKIVGIAARIEAERVIVKIRDEGPGFQPPHYRDWRDHTWSDEAILSERGRGLIIVRHYCEELRFNAEGNEATLMMRTH